MRHKHALLGCLLGASALLTGCGLLPQAAVRTPTAPVERADPSLAVIASHLEMMQRLNQSSPTEQAEVFKAAREAFEFAPTTSNRLRYALALATPGHGLTDPEAARQHLSELLASPETLLPAERALASVCLQDITQRLLLQAENRRLQADAARLERERGASTSRRLQAEIDENARLRKALAEAQAKLDEIMRIERSITERKPGNEGR